MATQDTTVTDGNDEEVDTGVETTQVEDENVDDEQVNQEDTDTGSDENTDTTEDDDNNDETDEDGDKTFKKRFTQFKGDSAEEYIPNLEEGYRKSTTEAQRLAQENKKLQSESDNYNKMLDFINKNPKVKEAIEKAGGEVSGEAKIDPALEYAREQMNKQLQGEYDKFAEAHPDILSDEDLKNELLDELEAVDTVYAKRGRKLSMTEGLEKAWRNLGYDDTKDKVMDKAKEQASTPNSQGTPKKAAGKAEFTEEQIAVAKKFGLTPEQLAAGNKKQ